MATKSSPTPRPGRARIGRPPRLTQEMIVEAAHEIGLDNVTMKSVADRLGVSVPGLYHHVRGKDDLLRLAAELSAGRIGVPDDHGQHWAEWLFEWALFNRSAFVADPGLIKQFTDGAIGAERTAQNMNTALGLLVKQGFTIRDARMVYGLISEVAIGAAVFALKEQQAAATGRPTLAELHRVLALREPHDLPYLRSMLADAMSNATTSLQEFHERLVVVLKGIACHRGEEWSSVEAKIQRFVEGGSAPLRSL
jgi:AcrR family transcriptional regulator